MLCPLSLLQADSQRGCTKSGFNETLSRPRCRVQCIDKSLRRPFGPFMDSHWREKERLRTARLHIQRTGRLSPRCKMPFHVTDKTHRPTISLCSKGSPSTSYSCHQMDIKTDPAEILIKALPRTPFEHLRNLARSHWTKLESFSGLQAAVSRGVLEVVNAF